MLSFAITRTLSVREKLRNMSMFYRKFSGGGNGPRPKNQIKHSEIRCITLKNGKFLGQLSRHCKHSFVVLIQFLPFGKQGCRVMCWSGSETTTVKK